MKSPLLLNKDKECLFIEIEINGVGIHIGIIYHTQMQT